MDIAIIDGDYVPDGAGGFLRAEGAALTAQRAMLRLSVKKGFFEPLPDFGSSLYRARTEGDASATAREALRGLDGVSVSGVTRGGDGRLRVALAVAGGPDIIYTGG